MDERRKTIGSTSLGVPARMITLDQTKYRYNVDSRSPASVLLDNANLCQLISSAISPETLRSADALK